MGILPESIEAKLQSCLQYCDRKDHLHLPNDFSSSFLEGHVDLAENRKYEDFFGPQTCTSVQLHLRVQLCLQLRASLANLLPLYLQPQLLFILELLLLLPFFLGLFLSHLDNHALTRLEDTLSLLDGGQSSLVFAIMR